ncbi:hypothetical protein DMUE_1409 [Dictyocoela muelleri]|nr:hypothetical protein DMUE_1409 [Dictyocoela muelleri]
MFKYKQKYNVGRVISESRWVLGIADTSHRPAKYYVKLVNNRYANTLLPIIQHVCRSGTLIWSDEWRSYNNVNRLGFNHERVNHTFNFVNSLNNCHTQNIESLWNKLKRRIKNKMGVKHELLQDYIDEWMWKDNVARDYEEKLYDLLKLK